MGNGWSATLVDAKHSSSYGSKKVFAGEAAAWVVRAPDGTVVYHTGDTDTFAGMEDIASVHKPTVALMCIGGHYTMGPDGAAYAVATHLAPHGLKTVVPMHYGSFPVLTGTPEQLQKELDARGCKSVEMRVMAPRSETTF